MNVSTSLIILAAVIGQGQDATCITTGDAGKSEREELTRICRETVGRVEDLLDSPVARVAIEVKEELYAIGMVVRNGAVALGWPSRARWLAASDELGFGDDTARMGDWADELLRHELAHFISRATIYGNPVPLAPRAYGTALPDWLEEAMAIWAEPAESRRQRIDRLLELDLDSIPELTAIVTARHPNTGESTRSPFTRTVTTIARGRTPYSSDRDSAVITTRIRHRVEADGRVTVDTIRMQNPPQASVIDQYFYALSYAALEYFREVAGERIVSRLIAISRNGVRGYDYVLDLPDTPSKPADLNADWRRWLERRLTTR